MDKPIVSVIVPLYNQADYIGETIKSVLNQSYTNWEMIVIDDGSTDNGSTIVKEFAANDTRISYYCQPNSGPSAARNVGISKSRGKYILPLDGDDKIGEKYLETATEYLENNEDCKLVYCKAAKFGLENGEWLLPDYQYDKLLWNNMIFCSAMYRRSDYNKTEGYNSNMIYGFEDWDFWLSLLTPNDKVYKIEDILFYYRIKTISRSTKVNNNYCVATRQVYMNHISLYANYSSDIISLHNDLYAKDKEINDILNGYTYKVGLIVTAPVRFFKKLFANQR